MADLPTSSQTGDSAWSRFVADFCVGRGLLSADRVERLRRSQYYMLAKALFDVGGRKHAVGGLLERAVPDTKGARHDA